MLKRLQTVAVSFLALLIAFGLAARYGQTEAGGGQAQRQVGLAVETKTSPVVVTRVALGNTVVQQGRFIKPRGTVQDPMMPFLAGDDWLQNVTVHVLNRTNRPIVYMSFNVSFPETTDETRVPPFRAIYILNLGRMPSSVYVDSRGMPIPREQAQPPIMFRPGEEMTIHLGDYIDQVKARIEPVRPLATLTTVFFSLTRLYFADGMRGGLGGFASYDPQSNTWRSMGPDYFPGHMDLNMPGRPGWFEQDHPIKEEPR